MQNKGIYTDISRNTIAIRTKSARNSQQHIQKRRNRSRRNNQPQRIPRGLYHAITPERIGAAAHRHAAPDTTPTTCRWYQRRAINPDHLTETNRAGTIDRNGTNRRHPPTSHRIQPAALPRNPQKNPEQPVPLRNISFCASANFIFRISVLLRVSFSMNSFRQEIKCGCIPSQPYGIHGTNKSCFARPLCRQE